MLVSVSVVPQFAINKSVENENFMLQRKKVVCPMKKEVLLLLVSYTIDPQFMLHSLQFQISLLDNLFCCLQLQWARIENDKAYICRLIFKGSRSDGEKTTGSDQSEH